MVTYAGTNLAASAGIPSQSSDTINPTPEGLVTGDIPALVTEDMVVAFSQTLEPWSLVGFDGSGNLIPAELGTTAAIGITVIGITTPGSGTKKAIPIYRQGVFNPAMLVWPATYNTDEKKLEAFRGAPTPTNIIIRPVKTATVVLP